MKEIGFIAFSTHYTMQYPAPFPAHTALYRINKITEPLPRTQIRHRVIRTPLSSRNNSTLQQHHDDDDLPNIDFATAPQLGGNNSKSTTEETLDKPASFKLRSKINVAVLSLDDSLILDEQREQAEEPRWLEERNESCSDLGDTVSEKASRAIMDKSCDRYQNIFRDALNTEDDEMESLWTLKRANPVLEDDTTDDVIDELSEEYESPPKRQCAALYWDFAIPTDAPVRLSDAWRLP